MERLIAQLPPPLQALLTPLNLALLAVLALIVHRSLPSLPTGPLPSKPTAYNWRSAAYPKTLVWASYTEAELRRFDGTYSPAPDSQPDERMLAQDGKPRILFAIRRKVYDVSSGRSFYGPGGPYDVFAGHDASRGLAKQSFEVEMLTKEGDKIDDLANLSKADWSNLRDWESTFQNKYILCGDYIESN